MIRQIKSVRQCVRHLIGLPTDVGHFMVITVVLVVQTKSEFLELLSSAVFQESVPWELSENINPVTVVYS